MENQENPAIAQMVRMHKELAETIQKSTSFHDQIIDACQSISKTNERLFESLKPIFNQQKYFQETFSNAVFAMPKIEVPTIDLSPLNVISEQIRKAISSITIPNLENIFSDISAFPENIKKALLILGEHGWYLDFEMPLSSIWELQHQIEKDNVVEVDEFLMDYYESNIRRIENSLAVSYPARQKILKRAFFAHKKKYYELSIPVLLAQSDGICKERLNYYIFIKKDKKPEVAQYVESLAIEDYSKALMNPLTTVLPIMKSERERGPSFSELNRHMVLHGESSDYGTRKNGCKALSLINYIGMLLK